MLLHIIRKAANLCMLLCCMYAVWDADDIGRRDIRRFIYAGHNEQNHNRRQYTCTMSNAHTVLCGGGSATTSSFYNGAMADDDDELHHIQYNNNMNANCSQLFGYIVWRHSAPQLDGWTHIKHAHNEFCGCEMWSIHVSRCRWQYANQTWLMEAILYRKADTNTVQTSWIASSRYTPGHREDFGRCSKCLTHGHDDMAIVRIKSNQHHWHENSNNRKDSYIYIFFSIKRGRPWQWSKVQTSPGSLAI